MQVPPALRYLCLTLPLFYTSCANFGTRSTDDLYTETALLTIPQNSEVASNEDFEKDLNFDTYAEKKSVKKWIDFFSGDGRERFSIFLQRGQQYKGIIQYVLKKHKMPQSLYYLAMIESGFNFNAVSSAKAVGVWQFMAPTAKRYGLRINNYLDERKDPIRASIAASQYLKDLYNVFGSWYLAIASYNAGEARVMNVIMRAKSRDYWELAEQGALPRETSDYAPQFVAAAIIGRNPEKYGFVAPVDVNPIPRLSAIKAPSQVDLRKIASALDLNFADLKRFNPHFSGFKTPPSDSYYLIWVPSEKKNKAKELQKLKPSLLDSVASTDPF